MAKAVTYRRAEASKQDSAFISPLSGNTVYSKAEARLLSKLLLTRNASRNGESVRVELRKGEQTVATRLNKVYSRYVWGIDDDAFNRKPVWDEQLLASALLHNTRWGRRVLEVGCGSGRLTTILAKHCVELVSIDEDWDVIARARAKTRQQNVSFACESMETFAQKRRFSAVLILENAIGMTIHAAGRRRFLRAAMSALAPGGLLVVGFRICSDNQSPKLNFQCFGYEGTREAPPVVGTLVNWSIGAFRRELSMIRPSGVCAYVKGAARPSGGVMAYALFAHRQGKRSSK